MASTNETKRTTLQLDLDKARRNYAISIYIVFCLIISLCPSCNSLSIIQKLTNEQQNKRFLRSSDDCNGDLQYSSYIQLDSVCKLCAGYLRDYREIYGQCRLDCYRNDIFLDICARQLLQYSEKEILELSKLRPAPSKTSNPIFFFG